MRDDFSESTKQQIEREVGGNCARQGCAKPTVTVNPDTGRPQYIGVAAHISAAAPNGPRFNLNLTNAQRRDPSNGIHLCSDCARIVDADPQHFTIEILQMWKKNAVERRSQQQHSPVPLQGMFDLNYCYTNAKKFLTACRFFNIDYEWSPSITWDCFYKMRELIRSCLSLTPDNMFSAQIPRWVNLQNEMIRTINSILDYIEYSPFWYFDSMLNAYKLKPILYKYEPITIGRSAPHYSVIDYEEYNKSIEESRLLILSRMNYYKINMNTLNTEVNSPPKNYLHQW